MSVATYTKAGVKATTPAKLDKDVFGLDVKNHQLVKDAYLRYLAAGRSAAPKTKKRGEVQGGGAKPWRQKGTGRARFGSSRNPIWRGGGIAFGPTGNENHTLKLNIKAKRQALRQALSMAVKSEKVIVVEDFAVNSGKTADAAKLLTKIGAKGAILLAVDNKVDTTVRAISNLSDVKLTQATYLTVFDILNADKIVITKAGLDKMSVWLGAAPQAKTPNKERLSE